MPVKVSPIADPDEARAVGLAALEAHQGDVQKAAKYCGVSVRQIVRWRDNVLDIEAAVGGRPRPPEALCDPLGTTRDFAPAPEVGEWVRRCILDPKGAIHNDEHSHLTEAAIGYLWTNVPCRKHGRTVVATAEFPSVQGSPWVRERNFWLLRQWFGDVPDFLITFDAIHSDQLDDASFCATVEHELYHCGQAKDDWGCPKFGKDGLPMFALRAHDAEEFVGVTERYGPGASAGGVAQLVYAGTQKPLIAAASISAACGTCMRV